MSRNRTFLKRIIGIFIFTSMVLYLGASTNFSASQVITAPSSALNLSTVPGSSDPNQDEWPMFRGQLNHTGETHTTLTTRAIPFWRSFEFGGELTSSPIVVGGRMYISGTDTMLWCINASTGQYLWMVGDFDNQFTCPAVADGWVFAGREDGFVYCLNAITTGCRWQINTGSAIFSSPAVAGGLVYIGCDDSRVYCLNATTGTQFWNYTTAGYVRSSPAVAGGRVYVGSLDDKVYCLNATTGKHLWNYTTAGDVSSSPAVAGGRVYVGSLDDKVYCLNATTGKQLWNYTTAGYVRSSPAVAGGCLYVGSLDDSVYCLNATTGTKLWNYTTAGDVSSSPAVAGGRVYVGSLDNNFYCLNVTTGTKLWNYTTGGEVSSSPAIADGRVYVGSYDFRVYCLPMNLDSTPPTYTSLTESADPLELGDTETITITGVADLSGIQTVKIAFDGSNHTMTNVGSGTWQYSSWIPSALGVNGYTIYIIDNLENCNMTSGTIQTNAPTPPTYTSVLESADPLELGQTETIWITGVADLSGIQTVKIAFEGSNHTMSDLGGGNWRYNAWTPSSANELGYYIYIQDNAGYWKVTSGTITVIETEEKSPIPAFALPLMILGLAIVGGLFILKRRTPF